MDVGLDQEESVTLELCFGEVCSAAWGRSDACHAHLGLVLLHTHHCGVHARCTKTSSCSVKVPSIAQLHGTCLVALRAGVVQQFLREFSLTADS